jgi:hypothetical protein
MTPEKQVTAFRSEISTTVERYALEFDISYTEMVGVLEEAKFWVLLDSAGLIEKEEEEMEEEEEDDSEGDSWKN